MIDLQNQSLRGWRAEVGMLAPYAGMYREYDVLAPEGIKFSRAVMGLTEPTPEGLKKLLESVEAETEKLVRCGEKDLICFGCTSGSFIGGPGYDQKVIARIEKASGGAQATTTTTCVMEIFKDMNIKKIAMVGPYMQSIFDAEVNFLKTNGIDTLHLKTLGLTENHQYWYLNYADPYVCYKMAKEAAKAAPNADCVFISCMMSPLMSIVEILEKETGKPVIGSLSATLYGILKKLRIPDPVPQYGQALTMPRV